MTSAAVCAIATASPACHESDRGESWQPHLTARIASYTDIAYAAETTLLMRLGAVLSTMLSMCDENNGTCRRHRLMSLPYESHRGEPWRESHSVTRRPRPPPSPSPPSPSPPPPSSIASAIVAASNASTTVHRRHSRRRLRHCRLRHESDRGESWQPPAPLLAPPPPAPRHLDHQRHPLLHHHRLWHRLHRLRLPYTQGPFAAVTHGRFRTAANG